MPFVDSGRILFSYSETMVSVATCSRLSPSGVFSWYWYTFESVESLCMIDSVVSDLGSDLTIAVHEGSCANLTSITQASEGEFASWKVSVLM